MKLCVLVFFGVFQIVSMCVSVSWCVAANVCGFVIICAFARACVSFVYVCVLLCARV